MRKHRRAAATALATALLSLPLLITGAAPANAAEPGTDLPLTQLHDIVADGSHQQVFLSDPQGDSVVVADYTGQVTKQLSGLDGAAGILLSEDSSTLYVALRDADAIAAYDTATLTETARYATGAGTHPVELAAAGGKIWFGYGDTGDGRIGSLDLSGAAPAVSLAQATGWYYAPLLAAAEDGQGDILVTGEHSLSPVTLAVYDVSTGSAEQQAYRWDPGPSGSSNLRDLAVTPDGRQVITASGYPYVHQVFSTTDLSDVANYPTVSYPNAVAVAPDGTVAAGADASYENDIYTFQPGAKAPLAAIEAAGDGNNLRPGGLAWAPDRSKLFAVTADVYGEHSKLHVLDNAGKATGTLTLSAPATAKKGKSLTVTGTLGPAGSYAPGAKLTVTRYDARTPGGTALPTVTAGADGSFSFTDAPRRTGTVKYVVTHAADDWHTAATAEATVQITR